MISCYICKAVNFLPSIQHTLVPSFHRDTNVSADFRNMNMDGDSGGQRDLPASATANPSCQLRSKCQSLLKVKRTDGKLGTRS
ncbi:hypothetical protein AMELA_G00030660 [Ameiurus melas]|uniref:Uncharacterized protein n=1 Tax=Ameiurus melas TaxID=219545 RepID=A0A7J6BAT8_AMEME|nr:hypothetical protein AMELA_G00030660 [Ameiurus melas]